eukprot:18222_1
MAQMMPTATNPWGSQTGQGNGDTDFANLKFFNDKWKSYPSDYNKTCRECADKSSTKWCAHCKHSYCSGCIRKHKNNVLKCDGAKDTAFYVANIADFGKGRCQKTMQKYTASTDIGGHIFKCIKAVDYGCNHCKGAYCSKHIKDHIKKYGTCDGSKDSSYHVPR